MFLQLWLRPPQDRVWKCSFAIFWWGTWGKTQLFAPDFEYLGVFRSKEPLFEKLLEKKEFWWRKKRMSNLKLYKSQWTLTYKAQDRKSKARSKWNPFRYTKIRSKKTHAWTLRVRVTELYLFKWIKKPFWSVNSSWDSFNFSSVNQLNYVQNTKYRDLKHSMSVTLRNVRTLTLTNRSSPKRHSLA